VRTPFILLDLTSQADFIPQEALGWPRLLVLAWLRQYWEVIEFPLRAGDNIEMAAMFIATTGLTATFVLADEGYFRLYLGERDTRTVWSPREVMPHHSG